MQINMLIDMEINSCNGLLPTLVLDFKKRSDFSGTTEQGSGSTCFSPILIIH